MRNKQLDIVKGIAIILVVLGHAIQYTFDNFDEVILFRIIYSFHMPLFMFVSGYLTKDKTINLNWLKRRFFNLIIPFTIWPLLLSLVNGADLFDSIKRVWLTYYAPSTGLWFLYILFLCHLVLFVSTFLCEKIHLSNVWGMSVFVIVIYILHYVIGLECLGFNELPWFIVFYFVGRMVGGHALSITGLNKPIKYVSLLVCVLLYLGLLPFWRRTEITPLLAQFEIHPLVISFANLFYRFVVAICGIAIIYYMAELVRRFRVRFIIYLGMHTVEIYILHETAFDLIKTGVSVIDVIVKTVLGIIVSLLVTLIVSKGVLPQILFGTDMKTTLR